MRDTQHRGMPFINTFIAVYASMYTRYTCTYNHVYTEHASKHPIYTTTLSGTSGDGGTSHGGGGTGGSHPAPGKRPVKNGGAPPYVR